MVLVLLLILWVIVNFNSVIELQTAFTLIWSVLVSASHSQIQALQARLVVSHLGLAAAATDWCCWLADGRLLVDNSDCINIAFRMLAHLFEKMTL